MCESYLRQQVHIHRIQTGPETLNRGHFNNIIIPTYYNILLYILQPLSAAVYYMCIIKVYTSTFRCALFAWYLPIENLPAQRRRDSYIVDTVKSYYQCYYCIVRVQCVHPRGFRNRTQCVRTPRTKNITYYTYSDESIRSRRYNIIIQVIVFHNIDENPTIYCIKNSFVYTCVNYCSTDIMVYAMQRVAYCIADRADKLRSIMLYCYHHPVIGF